MDRDPATAGAAGGRGRASAGSSTGAAPPAIDMVQGVLAAEVDRFRLIDPAARAGDVEAVHGARVALRRVRAILRSFADIVEEEWAAGAAAALRAHAAALGEVRDLDVLGARLGQDLDGLDGRPAGALRVRALLAEERAGALTRLGRDSGRSRKRLEGALTEIAGSPPPGPRARRRGGAEAARAAARAWKELERAARHARAAADVSKLHRVRIAAKRLRYAAEVAKDARVPHASRVARAAAALQDVLGEMHDAIAACSWLERTVRANAVHGADGDLAEIAGRVWSMEVGSAARAEARWPAAFAVVERAARR